MADLKRITLPSGSTYNLVDQGARDLIAALEGATAWLGVTTTALSDGATTNPIVIDEKYVTAKQGSMCAYGKKEFVFNGTTWQEFGDLSTLGALAYKDAASGSYTPAGTVSKPTFTGTEGNISASFTPAGTVSKPTFTGTEGNVSASFTPAGTVSKPTFTGTEGNVSASYTPAGSVTISEGTGTANYTPHGTVSAPSFTIRKTLLKVTPIASVGTLPEFTATVSNETLSLGWSAGTLPEKGAAVDAVADVSATASAPEFTGSGVELKATFSGTAGTATGKFTPAGSVSQPTFTGTAGTATGKFKPSGSVSQPTFTGTAGSATGKFTPEGTVSKPTFTGTAATIEVE